jgi:hypothetical protein
MHTNVPTHNTIHIIQNILESQQTPVVITDEIEKLTNIVINQNYFKHNSL